MKNINKVLLAILVLSISLNIYLLIRWSSNNLSVEPLFQTATQPKWVDDLTNKTIKIGAVAWNKFTRADEGYWIGRMTITEILEKNIEGTDGFIIKYVEYCDKLGGEYKHVRLMFSLTDIDGFTDEVYDSLEGSLIVGGKAKGSVFIPRTFEKIQKLKFRLSYQMYITKDRDYSAEYPISVILYEKQ